MHDTSLFEPLRGTDRLLLAALALLLLLPGTFNTSLTDRDEGYYARVSRETVEGGDWLIPHYLGRPWLFKPPLLYWCQAACLWLLGLNEFAVRLPSVLAMTAVTTCAGSLAAAFYGRRAGLIAGVCFISAGMPLIVGRLALADALLLLWIALAAEALIRFSLHEAAWRQAATFWSCVGLSLLTKGPAAAPFLIALGVGLLALAPARAHLRSGRLWACSAIAVAIALPWYLYVARSVPDEFWGRFVGIEIVDRLVRPSLGHWGPPGYYLATSAIGWLPWTGFVPGAILGAWQTRATERRNLALLVWLALPWLLLELLPTKLPHYALPCYLPLGMLLGRSLDQALASTLSRRQRIGLSVGAVAMILPGAALTAAGAIWRDLAWSNSAIGCGMILVLGFATVAWLALRRGLHSVLAGTVATTGLFHILVGGWLLPGFEPYRLSRLVAERANELAEPDRIVLVCGYTEPTVFFYLRGPVRLVDKTALASELSRPGQPVVLAVRAPEAEAAGIRPDPSWLRLEGFNYVRGRKETIWIGRRPPPATQPDPR